MDPILALVLGLLIGVALGGAIGWMLRSGRIPQVDPRPMAELQARSAAAEATDRKSTRLNSSHIQKSRMPSSA